MSIASTNQNGSVQQWIVGRLEPSGQFIAQVVGVPELHATAANREDAIEQIREMLGGWLASGQLIAIDVPWSNPLLQFAGYLDPHDPPQVASPRDRLAPSWRQFGIEKLPLLAKGRGE